MAWWEDKWLPKYIVGLHGNSCPHATISHWFSTHTQGITLPLWMFNLHISSISTRSQLSNIMVVYRHSNILEMHWIPKKKLLTWSNGKHISGCFRSASQPMITSRQSFIHLQNYKLHVLSWTYCLFKLKEYDCHLCIL